MSAVDGLVGPLPSTATAAVVGVVGPPGIGKSRLVREVTAMASRRGVEVFTTFCESHASQTPVPCRRATAARRHRRRAVSTPRRPAIACAPRFPTQTPRIWCCLMTCWASPTRMLALPSIDPDARRRRLTALVNAASLARRNPGGLCH